MNKKMLEIIVAGSMLVGMTAYTSNTANAQNKLLPNYNPDKEFIALDKPVRIIKVAEPEYPDLLRRAGIEGTTWVNITVNKYGKPSKTEIAKSSGYPALDSSAVNAAKKSLFTAGEIDNKPVDNVWISMPFRYKLK